MPRSRPARPRSAAPLLRAIEPLEPRTLLSVQLVADLNTAPASSNPSGAVQANGFTFFVADDGPHGREVWRTDGTAGGTILLRDIVPGPESSNPLLLGAAGNQAYFSNGTGVLWHTDGTAENTQPVQDLTGGASLYSNSTFTFTSATLAGDDFYTASGNKLYRVSGGQLTEVTLPGIPSSSAIRKVVVSGSRLYFLKGQSLYVSDGTSGGTTLVTQQIVDEVADLGGFACYSTLGGAGTSSSLPYMLWKTQGTAATASSIAPLPVPPTRMIAAGQTLYFWAGSTRSFSNPTGALWKSDGTTAGTMLVKDVPLAANQVFPYLPPLVVSGGKVFFSDAQANRTTGLPPSKLWVSDGTPDGTIVLRSDVSPLAGSPSYSTDLMRDWNGTVLFQGREAAGGSELWKTDGTEAGTTRVVDLVPGADSSVPQILGVDGSRVLLAATTPDLGHELWTTDGTAAGTLLLKDLNTGTASSNPAQPVSVNGKLLFMGPGGLLVITNPAAPPHELTFADPAVHASSPGGLTPAGSRVFFYAQVTGFSGDQLCVTDGTPEGTRVVTSLSGLGTSNFTAVGGRLYFTGGPSGNETLYTSDGTAEGTIALASGFYFTQPNFGVAGNRLYFSAQIGTTGSKELWTSDGTPAGTTRVASFPASGSLTTRITAANGRVYFLGGDQKTYQTDGTPAGTSLFGDGTDSIVGATPNGSLLFVRSGGNLMGLGAGDSTPVLLATGVFGASLPPVALGKWMYFVDTANRLWRTDGTPAGTTRLANASQPASLVAAGHLLYYTGVTPATGRELYATDGTPGGTYLVADMIPGPGSPVPTNLTAVGDTLYFVATDGVHGRELWRAIDDVPPAALTSSFNYAANPQTLTVTFSENVGDSLALPEFKLLNRATGQDVSSLLTSLSFNPDTDTATLTLAPNLPKGDYRLVLPAGAAADPAGNPTAADATLDFFHLPGDANRDRTVNFADLLALAKNYNKTAATWADGDFNGDGTVNFADLLALARNYNTTLPALPTAPLPAAALAAPMTAARPKPAPVFRVTPVPPKRPPAPPKRQPATPKHR